MHVVRPMNHLKRLEDKTKKWNLVFDEKGSSNIFALLILKLSDLSPKMGRLEFKKSLILNIDSRTRNSSKSWKPIKLCNRKFKFQIFVFNSKRWKGLVKHDEVTFITTSALPFLCAKFKWDIWDFFFWISFYRFWVMFSWWDFWEALSTLNKQKNQGIRLTIQVSIIEQLLRRLELKIWRF